MHLVKLLQSHRLAVHSFIKKALISSYILLERACEVLYYGIKVVFLIVFLMGKKGKNMPVTESPIPSHL